MVEVSAANGHQAARELSQASTIRDLVDLLSQDGQDSFLKTDQRLVRASVATTVIWLLFTAAVLRYSPAASFQAMLQTEREVCTIAFVLLLISNISRFLPLIYRDRVVTKRRSMFKNGFMVAALTVQVIAMCACGLMAFFPTPVFVDPVSGGRVFLIRWAEWAPLGFLLTFLSEEIDMPTPENIRIGFIHACIQGTLVCFGFIFPFVSDPRVWWNMATVAIVMYCTLFVRIYEKATRLKGNVGPGQTIFNPQLYDRARLSLRSLQECAVLWTLLVVLHFAAAFAPKYLPDGHWLNTPALPMYAETFCEVASKHLHILVVESVFSSFSEHAKNDQTLDLLRRTMTVVWERSSDTIAVTVKKKDRQVCMVSPTFFDLASLSSTKKDNEEPLAIVFEVPLGKKVPSTLTKVYCVSLPDRDTREENVTPFDFPDHLMPSVQSLADLLMEAWKLDDPPVMMHDVVKTAERPAEEIEVCHCEVTVTKMEANTMVAFIRDISERVKRFEAEKKFAVESTEREKDSQTNRFTRHEVKNGLLSAIGLCESMKDGSKSSTGTGTLDKNTSCILELEATLNEILDTVLSEVMSRDVIHGDYDLREEKVEIRRLLDSTRLAESRFPVTSSPKELPLFLLDPQLFRFVHRNALSNACKYGKLGGVVSTIVKYDSTDQLLSVDVINEPGEYHDVLVELGDQAAVQVFKSGQRLHSKFEEINDDREVSFSSGDGAWIMRKCARMLGGDVSIAFNPERTIFNLSIPARPVSEAPVAVTNQAFIVPSSTIGIAIDDSKVQRKLLDRLLSHVGIEKEKRIILGGTADEILNFDKHVKELVESEPSALFLIIADENLDMVEDSVPRTISGSICIERLRKELKPKDEARMLALVRSANDSSQDVATYRDRCHGFLLKAPIRKDVVVDLIYPLWRQRFPDEAAAAVGLVVPPSTGEAQRSLQRRSSGAQSLGSTEMFDSETNRGAATTASADLLQIVEALDQLILEQQPQDENNWQLVRDKFQMLKGDMMTLITRGSPRVVAVVDALDEYRAAEHMPEDMAGRWKLIRALIVSLI